MNKLEDFLNVIIEKNNLSIKKITKADSNKSGRRYEHNGKGIAGKYFKRLDRIGKMVSDRDKKANTSKENLKTRLKKLRRGKKVVLNKRQEATLNDSGARSVNLKDGAKKRLNSKSKVSMQRKNGKVVVSSD